ncbi:MAG: preprotein translocase subunit YajC [Verrucomicrobiales bacterium]
MRFTDLSSWPLTVATPLFVALILLFMRMFVMGRAQEKRQRANRQQTERLKSLVSAYRVLAGSFQPLRDGEIIGEGDQGAIEAALSDILLFGSANQVAMAAECAHALVQGKLPPLAPLVNDLRRNLRVQLGLAPLDEALELPIPGPLRGKQAGREKGNGGEREGAGARGGGGGGGGAGGGMLLGGSASAGFHADETTEQSK